MTDEELLWFASEFREGILDGGPSDMMCFAICAPLVTLLNMHGVKCDMVEGDILEGGLNHVWLRLSDGRVLDPTADQFNGYLKEVSGLPPVYLGERHAIIHPAA